MHKSTTGVPTPQYVYRSRANKKAFFWLQYYDRGLRVSAKKKKSKDSNTTCIHQKEAAILQILPLLNTRCPRGRRGGGRLKVRFQPLMVISPKLDSMVHGGVWGCRCGELIWTCFVWAGRSTPNTFGVPSHQLNSATDEQKWITQTIIVTLGMPVGCLTNKCQAPSWAAQIPQY